MNVLAFRSLHTTVIRCGYHAIPSVEPLHVHIVSQDFDSPDMFRNSHWNGFTTGSRTIFRPLKGRSGGYHHTIVAEAMPTSPYHLCVVTWCCVIFQRRGGEGCTNVMHGGSRIATGVSHSYISGGGRVLIAFLSLSQPMSLRHARYGWDVSRWLTTATGCMFTHVFSVFI